MSRTLRIVLPVALVARLVAWWLQPGLTYDGTYYLRQAERLLHLDFQIIGFPPGYPAVVALAQLVVRDGVLAGRLVSLLAGLASLVLFVGLARGVLADRGSAGHVEPARATTPPWVLVAALLLAVHPHVLMADVSVLSEPLYIALVLGGVLAYERGRLAAGGAALGMAFLCRPEAVLVLVGLVVLHVVRKRRVPWNLAGIGLLPVVVYAGLASRAVGALVLTPKQGQLDVDRDVLARLRTTFVTLHAVFPLVLLPFALAEGVRRRVRLLLPVLYLGSLPFFAIHIQERLHLPALPLLLLLGLAAVQRLGTRWRRPLLATAAALLAWGLAPGYVHLARSDVMTPHARAIGEAMRPHVQFEDRIAGRFPFVAYYAGAGFVRIPIAPVLATIDSVERAGATHFLVLQSEMRDRTPHLRPLMDDAGFITAESRLRQVSVFDALPGHGAILYAMQPRPVIRATPAAAGDPRPDPRRCQVAGWRLAVVNGALQGTNLTTGAVRPVRLQGLDPAAATPLAVAARGTDIAITYARTGRRRESDRVLATARWPASLPAQGVIELPGRWATELPLFDDAICWIPDADRLIAAVAIFEYDADGQPLRRTSTLAVVERSGRYRRLTYDDPQARRPYVQGNTLWFTTGGQALSVPKRVRAELRPGALEIPTVRTLDVSGVRPTRSG